MILRFARFLYFLYFALLFVVLIIIAFPFTLFFLLLPKKICDRLMFFMMKGGAHILFTLSGIITKNYHREKIGRNRSYIIIPNHQSFIDAATIYTTTPFLFKTLGKKELEKTPLYGLIYKTVVITVDRSSLSARALSVRKMKQELEDGLSIIIFPEGTFPDQAHPRLVPFREGGFSLAVLQQGVLLPVLYLDSPQRMHPSQLTSMSPGMNRCVYLPPFNCSGLGKQDVKTLTQYMQQYMQACLDHCRKVHPSGAWEFANSYLQQYPFVKA